MQRLVLKTLQANILLDDDRRVCLADFGLARFTDAQQITMGGNSWHSGALRWMPPEVLSGAKIDYAGDVYSFGCVCLEVSAPCLQPSARPQCNHHH